LYEESDAMIQVMLAYLKQRNEGIRRAQRKG
jgi:hypothetical protein